MFRKHQFSVASKFPKLDLRSFEILRRVES